MSKRKFKTNLPAPYLKRITWSKPNEERPKDYPFSLPFLNDPDWYMDFKTPVTVIVGENGTGKSTLIEAIAGLAGYDEAGCGKGYCPSSAREIPALAAGGSFGAIFTARCSIPDDYIAPRRSALFMARWVLTEARGDE